MLIGDVAKRTGISARMLRHYDRMGVVTPGERTRSGYRQYTERDLRRLFEVEGLRSLGLTLAEIPAALDDEQHSTRGMLTRLVDRARTQLAAAKELVERLEHVQTASPEAWHDVMRTIELMRGFDGNDPSTRQRHALPRRRRSPGHRGACRCGPPRA
ncbi:MAG: MerR family transcriptional regulator [Nannocystales bacterium]